MLSLSIHTIITLEKLLGARSFGGSIDHLVHYQTMPPIFSNKLGFLSVV
jgi:hypothetical protein